MSGQAKAAAATTAAAGDIPPGFKELREGRARILLQTGNEVFYNEAQVTNRDLSVAVLRRYLSLREQEAAEGKLKAVAKKEAKQARKQAARERQQQQQQQGKGAEQAQGGEAKPEGGAEAEAEKAEEGKEQQQQQQKVEGEGQAAKEGGEAKAEGGEPAAAAAGGSGGQAGGGKAPGGPRGPRPARLLEGLAASGLRSIRYALEVPALGRIDANDMDKDAVAAIGRNVALNGGAAADKIRVLCSDARMTMLGANQGYEVVDLDPYGTPAPLLDSALQAVSDGGLLMVTATDMANLCGNNSTACWSNYGIYPVHRAYCHEMALRILLACIETHAARYRRHIVPLLSLHVDFYCRLFLRVHTNANACKDSPSRLAHLWQSSGCDSFWLQPVGQKRVQGNQNKYMPGHGPPMEGGRCPDSGSNLLMGGPIWSQPLHDFDFVQGLLSDLSAPTASSDFAQAAKIRGLLLSVAAELPDAPLYYDLHDVCRTVRCTAPKSDVFKSALVNAGYRVSGSHANPLAVKTDAPPGVVWDVVRCWVRKTGASAAALKDPDSYSAKILAKEPTLEASFALAASAVGRAKDDKTPRFVQNPAYWGPKARHGRPDQTRPQQQGGGGQQGGKGKGGQKGGKGDKRKGRGEQGGEGEGEGTQEGAGNGGQAEGGKERMEVEGQVGQVAEGAAGEGEGEPDAKRQKS